MGNLEDKIKEQEQKLQNLAQSMIDYSTEIDRLKKETKEKTELYDETISSLEILSGKVSGFKDSTEQLKVSISERSEELSTLVNEIRLCREKQESSVKEHDGIIEKKQEQIRGLGQEIQRFESDLSKAKSAIGVAEQNLASLNSAANKQEKECEELAGKISKIVSSSAKEQDRLDNEIRDLETSKRNLEGRISSLKHEISDLEFDKNELAIENEKLSLALDDIKKELTERRELIAADEVELEKKKDENRAELKKIENKNKSLENRERNVTNRELRVQKKIRDKRLDDENEELSS